MTLNRKKSKGSKAKCDHCGKKAHNKCEGCNLINLCRTCEQVRGEEFCKSCTKDHTKLVNGLKKKVASEWSHLKSSTEVGGQVENIELLDLMNAVENGGDFHDIVKLTEKACKGFPQLEEKMKTIRAEMENDMGWK